MVKGFGARTVRASLFGLGMRYQGYALLQSSTHGNSCISHIAQSLVQLQISRPAAGDYADDSYDWRGASRLMANHCALVVTC